ncbi:MAG: hypothetical protein RL340_1322 [Gemmatimonadota bacterium]
MSVRPVILFAALLASSLSAQEGSRDSVRTARRDTLDAVVVRATRVGAAPPTSQTLIDRATIERTYVGQDAPLALLGATGVTAASDAGAFSGYSSLRLRGIDQTRLAISVDGVPLNDPEDQVLYFSNVPDFMHSMGSVRVQRGVGGSGFGPAGFAGALSFESLPLATTPAFREAEVTAGSWGTRRVSAAAASGVRGSFAAYGRATAQTTDGYRINSGNDARSAFGSAAWFGDRDVVKVTGFAGRSQMQLAYYAASEADLALDPRTNPMSPDERDDFSQSMLSLQHTRSLGRAAAITTTLYRNAAGGTYDVAVGDDLWNFGLDHTWVGLLSTATWTAGAIDWSVGGHVSDYAREHSLRIRPVLATDVYANTGHKGEQSAFAKAVGRHGALEWVADLQLRQASFRYEPSAGVEIGSPEVTWRFANPKLGVTWQAGAGRTLHASVGRASREPTRVDLFAGADDLDAATAAEVLPLTRVRPEQVTDVEVGVRQAGARGTVAVNLFSMRFRDEIAAIGALAITGSPLRRNVPRSTRAGMELEGSWTPAPTWRVDGNLVWMRARIAEYVDETAGVTYRDVPPLLTPAVTANLQTTWSGPRGRFVTLGARHVGRSFLANDGNAALSIPAFTVLDGGITIPVGRQQLRLQGQNLLSATAYAAGYHDGTTRYLFPVAPATFLATWQVTF